MLFQHSAKPNQNQSPTREMLEKKSSKSVTQKEILNTGCKVTLMQDAKSTKKH